MTDEERKALVERLRWGHWYFDDPFDGKAYASDDPLEAADQIEADGQRIAELEGLLREAEVKLTDVQGAYATKQFSANLLARISAALGDKG